jgi:carbohydrate binding protein with CBM6 domain
VSIAASALRTLTLALLAGLSLPLAAQTQTPFGGMPIALPGTFEAENFDNGGEGVAYHDNVGGNAGGQYRTGESVDIAVTSDPAGGGYSVINFETGEWLEYTVAIQAAGQYEIAIRTSSGTFTGAFHIEIDGANVTGSVTVPPTGDHGTWVWVAKKGVSLPAGQHVLRLVSEQQYFHVNQIRVTATPSTPFAGPITLPGTIEAENYDNGGQDVSYNDTTATNEGGQFRSDGVDIITSRDPDDAGAGFGVNNFRTGEWLVYTVNVASTGLYDIEARVATGTFATAALHIEIDGVNVTGSLVPGATGGMGTYVWVKKPSVQLSAGQHVLKLVSDQEWVDVNRMRVTAVTHTPFRGTPISLPGTFEAEDFDLGGEGNAYHDNVPGNSGGQYRTSEDVDIAVTSDPAGGGYSVINFETGESLAYTVDIQAAGQYELAIRTSSGTFTGAFHIELDGANVTGSVTVPPTGDHGTWVWVAKTGVSLPAGQHTLRLVSEQQYFHVNQIRVVPSTAPAPNPPNLLFRSGFESGVSVGAPRDCYPAGCWQDILGTDSSTSFTWPPIIAGGEAQFQVRSGTSTNPGSTISDFIVNEIRTVTGHKGVSTRALYTEIKQNCSRTTGPQGEGCGAQDSYLLQHASEPGDMYISFWRKLQPDLFQKMSANPGGSWYVIYEWKTVDDFRVIVQIVNYSGTPRWMIVADNEANGPFSKVEYWRVENSSVPVPIDQWFKFEVFWHRSSGADGRVWMAINGKVIVDKLGPLMGVNHSHINRNFIHQLYTGGAYPVFQLTDDYQIWSGFPTASPGDPWYDPPYAPH